MARLTANHPLQTHPLMPPSASTSTQAENAEHEEVILPFSKRPIASSTATTTTTSSSSQANNNAKMKKQDQIIHQLPRSIRWRLNLGLLTMPSVDSINNHIASAAAASHTTNDKKSTGTLPAKDLIFDSPTQLREVSVNNNTTSKSSQEESGASSSAAVASLLQYIEDTNALKLRCQRSRYDELEQKHYYSNTIMGIADGSTTSQHQTESTTTTTTTAGGGGEQSQQPPHPTTEAASPISSLVGNKLHHVAPGDDPLSALLTAPNNNNTNQGNGMFGFGKGNRNKKNNQSVVSSQPSTTVSNEKHDGGDTTITTTAATAGANNQSTTTSNNNPTTKPNQNGSYLNHRRASDNSNNSTENKEETIACKGSRWADYYSTREVLDVIEKDLNRLPNDHYTIYHEWKRYNDDELARKRLLESGTGAAAGGTVGTNSTSGAETTPSMPTLTRKGERKPRMQKNQFGNSFRLKNNFNFGSNSNFNNPNAANNSNMSGGDNKNAFWSNLISKDDDDDEGEDDPAASAEVSRKERADRLSQLLFVYAREHPEVGYRQGMHETLSFILLALEMDLLEQSVQKEKSNWKRDIMELRRPSMRGGMAGVDASGTVVVVRLLDQNYLLHDAFALFECVMSALAPAYDAIPAGEEATTTILEKAKLERGESPMEAMVSKILSKIRFVARDEALFGMVLCMPVPPQIYFAKWVRLMFGREVAGGMKNVMRLWDAFFDLAAKIEKREEEIPLSLALMNVLETAAASMIVLIRDKLLKPSMARDGTLTGDPDPNEGIAYVMNYPPIEDIDHFIKLISSLLLKAKSLSQMYVRRISQEEEERNAKVEDPFVTGTGRLHDQNRRPRQVAPLSSGQGNMAAQPPLYTQHPKVDVAESIGNFAAGLLDIGTRTVDAAISTYQKHQAEKQQHQIGVIDHPLQFGFNNPPPDTSPQDRVGEGIGRNNNTDTYTVTYRNHRDTEPLEGQDIIVYSAKLGKPHELTRTLSSSFTTVENGSANENQGADFHQSDSELASPRGKNLGPNHDSLDAEEETASIHIDQLENGDDTMRPRPTPNRPRSNSRSSRSLSRSMTNSLRKSPKELAKKLDKSVKTLMRHFEQQQQIMSEELPTSSTGGATRIIPEEIWEAMAAIDAVKKELLTQDALETLER